MNTSHYRLDGLKSRGYKLGAPLMVLGMFLLSSLTAPGPCWAQPSDAQIIKDLKSPGVLSVTLSKKGGGKVWSRTDLQYYWERGAVVTRKADVPDMPDVKLEIGGLATYTIVGGKYVFKKFYVTWNDYQGIPKPTEKEIMTLMETDRRKVFGYAYNRIVGDVEKLKLADDPKWTWHTPNSVSFNMVVVAPQIINNTDVARIQQIYEVRLYRDKVKDPWKNFISSPGQGDERKELSKKTYTAEEVRAMKTLADSDVEKSTGPTTTTTLRPQSPAITSQPPASTAIASPPPIPTVQIEDPQPITWTPHTAANARLKISFPATPKATEGKMNDKYPMHTLEVAHPSALYRVVSVIYPTKLNRQQATLVINSAAQSFIQNNRARIVSQSDYTTGTMGRTYTLDRDGNPIKYRVYVIDDVLYQLIMSADKAAFTTANEKAFFDSFEAVQ